MAASHTPQVSCKKKKEETTKQKEEEEKEEEKEEEEEEEDEEYKFGPTSQTSLRAHQHQQVG